MKHPLLGFLIFCSSWGHGRTLMISSKLLQKNPDRVPTKLVLLLQPYKPLRRCTMQCCQSTATPAWQTTMFLPRSYQNELLVKAAAFHFLLELRAQATTSGTLCCHICIHSQTGQEICQPNCTVEITRRVFSAPGTNPFGQTTLFESSR